MVLRCHRRISPWTGRGLVAVACSSGSRRCWELSWSRCCSALCAVRKTSVEDRGVRGAAWTCVRRSVRRALVFSIVHWERGFVAVGRRSVAGERTGTRAAVWTSTDGEHWEATPGVRFPSGTFPGFGTLAVRRGVLVTSSDGTELWRSTDAKTWRRVARLDRTNRIGSSVAVGPRGFVATGDTLNPWDSPVSTSPDGRHWKTVERTGTMTQPVGLFPEAQLGSASLSVGPSINNTPPNIYSSKDGAQWSPIPGTNVPERFGSPLVANRRHTHVLGIEYEQPGSFGGKLWSSRNAKTWEQIASFHDQMPTANPDHMVQEDGWWVVGGNNGTPDRMRRASIWTSRDLRHWYEMPEHLWGPKTQGVGVTLTAAAGRVVGLGISGRTSQLWVWTPPD